MFQATDGGVEEVDGESASDADGSVKDRPGTAQLEYIICICSQYE